MSIAGYSRQDILRLVMDAGNFPNDMEFTAAEVISRISKLLTPPEPTGYGALVMDVEGQFWLKVGHAGRWRAATHSNECDWDWLNKDGGPVRILFAGIEND